MRFAEVAVDAPTGHSRTFSYSIPDHLGVVPGHLVKVPFGARTLSGVVFSLESKPQVPETRDIEGIYIEEPVLDGVHLDLARWISQYYICSLFEAAAIMLPPGGRIRPKTYLSLSEEVEVDKSSLTSLQKGILTYLGNRKGTANQTQLVKLFGDNVSSSVTRLVNQGFIERTIARAEPRVQQKYAEHLNLNAEAVHDAKQWLHESASDVPRRAALIEHLLEEKPSLPLSDARKAYGTGAVKWLLEHNWANKERIAVERDPLEGRVFPPVSPVTLTRRQSAIAAQIRSALDGNFQANKTFLIQGVTGSGKTEIYLDAVQHCLEFGKKAIVMVPEISLTYQTIERFASRFPGQVAVLHSGLSSGERFDQWWKIQRGEYGVVIGSRSVIFAPQPDLGIVVIDEEHEWTYKQHDGNPRYHARDVAVQLANRTKAMLVLGSASPDIASYYKGLTKQYQLSLLPDRVALNGMSQAKKTPLAQVQIVDMREELREGNRDIFSRPLKSAMDECLGSNQQVLLFLNRRGSASYLLCRNCGFGLKCSRCEVTMTYHRQSERFLCHYCGLKRRAPEKCPQCLSYRMSYYGIGTQTVAEEAQRRYPNAKVIRWDSDVTKGPKAYEDMLAQFRSGEAQILVGTQMIAKGLHIPSVTLVGAISADVGLGIPDYRSGERVFQLLCQVAGRAGRGSQEGEVIFQTYQPENYAITSAASQEYQTFYTKEMAFRREQSNPPYTKLIRLIYTHTNRAKCERESEHLADILQQQRGAWGLSDTEVLGPTPTYPARVKGRYRWHIILRGPEPRTLLDKVDIPKGWAIDVDPVSLT